MYNDLCKRENLSKCPYGCTQNRNESFTGMIQNHVPKANYEGIDILNLGVYDATAHFNAGAIAFLDILKDMNMKPGDHRMKDLLIQNEPRKIHAPYRMSEPQLKRRKIIRHCRKKKQDRNLDKEGTTCEAGGFYSLQEFLSELL